MHTSMLSVLALGCLLSVTAASSCDTGNNCLRAVIGSAFPTRHGKADCSSYLAVTVTPATVTITAIETDASTKSVYSTVTSPTTLVTVATETDETTRTVGPVTVYQKRQNTVSATAIPAYASACSGAVKYSSACSCIGVTRYTVTLGTSTVATSTTTISVATSVVLTTVAPTVTVGTTTTVTHATTFTSVVVKPKVCNARGLPGANAFNYDANFNTNQAACIASCKTDSRCLSTGFYIVTDPSTGSQTGTCRKYDKSVTDSADLGFGYYNFNDKAC